MQISWQPKPYHPPEKSVESGPLQGATFILDCTECRIAKPVDVESEYYYKSGKAHVTTIKYEVATQISTGRIMWVSGGGPGREHDNRVLRANGLLDHIPEGEIGIADKGYRAADFGSKLMWPVFAKRVNGVPSLTWGEHLYNFNLCSLRIEVERVFGRMKKCFTFLTHCRDHNLHRHRQDFMIIANIFNIMIEFQPMRANNHQNLINPPTHLPTPPRAPGGLRGHQLPDEE